MITKQDLEHHLRRERQERLRALETNNAEARVAHLALADSHGRRAANARAFIAKQEGSRPLLSVVVGA